MSEVDIENANLVPRGDYVEVLQRIVDEGNCPFCEEQLPRHHPQPVLWQSDHWTVTTNAWPYKGTRLHFLVVSRTHVERIEELSSGARVAFFEDYDRIMREHGLAGASMLWRSGDMRITGASVHHLHAQIIVGHPRTEGCGKIKGLLGFMPT